MTVAAQADALEYTFGQLPAAGAYYNARRSPVFSKLQSRPSLKSSLFRGQIPVLCKLPVYSISRYGISLYKIKKYRKLIHFQGKHQHNTVRHNKKRNHVPWESRPQVDLYNKRLNAANRLPNRQATHKTLPESDAVIFFGPKNTKAGAFRDV